MQASQVGMDGTIFKKVPVVHPAQVFVPDKKPRPAWHEVHLVAESTHAVHGSWQILHVGGAVPVSRNCPAAHI